jgi:hypothetical protein
VAALEGSLCIRRLSDGRALMVRIVKGCENFHQLQLATFYRYSHHFV